MANKQPITQIDINNLDALLREGKVDEFYDVLYKKGINQLYGVGMNMTKQQIMEQLIFFISRMKQAST